MGISWRREQEGSGPALIGVFSTCGSCRSGSCFCGWSDGVGPELCLGQVTATWADAGEGQGQGQSPDGSLEITWPPLAQLVISLPWH